MNPQNLMPQTSYFYFSSVFNATFEFSGDRREGINTAVSTDVQTVFKGKTYSQLQALNLNIESKIRAGGSNLDIGYWESLLQQVRVYMARARYSYMKPYCDFSFSIFYYP